MPGGTLGARLVSASSAASLFSSLSVRAALRAHAGRIATSGTRAADMALRLHYDDVATADVRTDPERAVRAAVAAARPDQRVVVFSTYTAMWALHAVLQRIGEAAA